jgi:hypothetical protein
MPLRPNGVSAKESGLKGSAFVVVRVALLTAEVLE